MYDAYLNFDLNLFSSGRKCRIFLSVVVSSRSKIFNTTNFGSKSWNCKYICLTNICQWIHFAHCSCCSSEYYSRLNIVFFCTLYNWGTTLSTSIMKGLETSISHVENASYIISFYFHDLDVSHFSKKLPWPRCITFPKEVIWLMGFGMIFISLMMQRFAYPVKKKRWGECKIQRVPKNCFTSFRLANDLWSTKNLLLDYNIQDLGNNT